MQIEIGALRIYYEQFGDTNNPHILLLHGWGSSVDAYRLFIGNFSDKFFITAVDFPGFGKSDMIREPWDALRYAQFTADFIKALKLHHPILIGHSHGGRTIIKLVGSGIYTPPKAVLIDPSGLTHKRTLKQKLRTRTFKTIKRLLSLPLIKNYTQDLLEKAKNHFGSADYRSAPEVLRNTLVKLISEDMRPVLPNIKCPTLLIWGENDTATPLSDGYEMEKLIPDAGLCTIKGAGHFSFVEKPFEVHKILESFL